MPNGYSFSKTIAINASADDWQLFTNMDGATAAADALNRGMETILNSGCAKDEAYSRMNALLDQYEDFGAADSEPTQYAERMIERHYAA